MRDRGFSGLILSDRVDDNSRVRSFLEEKNLKNHNSLEPGITELKVLYQEEENRRSSIETKTSATIAINGILLGLFYSSNFTANSQIPSILLLISVLICVWNIYPKSYLSALALKEIPSYTDKDTPDFLTEVYIGYYCSISHNSYVNDVRYKRFLLSVSLTSLSVIAAGSIEVV